VSFDESFEPRSHDQLDACVSAVTAAAYRNRIDGLHTRFVGTPVFRDDDGSLREGEIMCLRPKEASALGKRLNHAVTAGPQVEASASRRTRRPRPVPQHQPLRPRTKAYASELKSQLTEGDPQRRASQTLAWLVQQAGEESNDPVLLSYGAAWRLVYLQPNPTGHGANAYKPVIELARLIGPIHLANLGPVMLDCFLVNASKKSPGEGHWQTAQYDEDEWARVFGNATVIKASDVVL
jgi:hypothetical protein